DLVLSPLVEAAASGDRYLVELLLEVHGANPSAHGGLAEHMALQAGHHLVANLIFQRAVALRAAQSAATLQQQQQGSGCPSGPAGCQGGVLGIVKQHHHRNSGRGCRLPLAHPCLTKAEPKQAVPDQADSSLSSSLYHPAWGCAA
ncbi:hypothetical protein HaLaN_26200, partial [Haematococcus lacustris]